MWRATKFSLQLDVSEEKADKLGSTLFGKLHMPMLVT